jgi:hypothetical protein
VLLALVGEEWLTITDADGRRRLDDPDDFVRLEIEAALTRNVRVIPILIDEQSRSPSSRRRWLGILALVTGGLVLAAGIVDVILYPDQLGDLGINLNLGLLFLVGWILQQSRPVHGAAIIGISAAGSTVAAMISLSGGLDSFLLLILLSAVAAFVLSMLVIRSRAK